jgi:hypothetical protein
MKWKSTLLALSVLAVMAAFPTASYAPGNKTYIDYYSDAAFTVLVGGETHGCAETPTSWGVVGQYRRYNVFPCGSDPEFGFVTCWEWVNGTWVQITCP